jgi:DUF4097 and DUF4098 domain-containing protein YvlB
VEAINIVFPKGSGLRVQARSGRVHVIAEERDDVLAETDVVEYFGEENGEVLVVRSAKGGSKQLTVRCPIGTDVDAGTQSGSVRLEGPFGSIRVTTISGNIEVDKAEDADMRTMSGKISIGSCHGRCRMNAVSGNVTGGEVESATASSVSGSIKIGRVNADLRARTVSGSVDVAACGDSPIAVKTVSGRVRIELPEGTAPETHFRTRGHISCDLPKGRDCRIDAASLSGSIEVVAT